MSYFGYGVVRFDSDNANDSGWAAIAGHKPFRISSHGDLDNQTLWWSNLSFKSMYACNLHKTLNIKRTTFLNTWTPGGQEDVCDSWGLNDPRFSEQIRTQLLSAFFNRTMNIAHGFYGMPMDVMPAGDNLADEMRVQMLPKADRSFGPEMDAALKSAHQYFCYPVTPRLSGDDYVTINFIIPPVRHAQNIIDSLIPSSEVKYIPAEALPPSKHRIDWALGSERPLLLKINVSQISPDVVNVLGFGNGSKMIRNWVSQPELLMLSRYANVDISAAWMFSEYQNVPSSCKLPFFTRLQAMSPTAELIASNHWVSLCRSNPYSLEPGAAGERKISPRSVWLNAMDRFFCFKFALQLSRAGILVKKYGTGSVTCIVPKYNYRDAYEVASSIGLLSPSKIVGDILMQEDLQHV